MLDISRFSGNELYIGIDPGAKSGVAILHHSNDDIIFAQVLHHPATDTDYMKKIESILRRVDQVLSEHPGVVYGAVEKTILGEHGNVNSAGKLYEMSGALCGLLMMKGIEVRRYLPQQWRGAWGCNNSVPDAVIKRLVDTRYNWGEIKKPGFDAYVGICLAHCIKSEIALEGYEHE